jgi:hypothetical protein
VWDKGRKPSRVLRVAHAFSIWATCRRHVKPLTAVDSQSGLSSGEHVRGRLFLAGTVVAEPGREPIDASSGEGQDGLGVALALGSFAVVIGLRGWTALDADHR